MLQCPTVLKLPVETKLQPVLAALTALGLNGEQVAQLLRGCPKLLGESKDGLVSRWVLVRVGVRGVQHAVGWGEVLCWALCRS